MAHYLIEVGYTAQSWSTQIDTKANVVDRITPGARRMRRHARVDVLRIRRRTTSSASSTSRSPRTPRRSGWPWLPAARCASYKTTPLLSVEQGMTSMKKAAEIRKQYAPPTTVSLVEQRTPAKRSEGQHAAVELAGVHVVSACWTSSSG